jgi:BRCT domain type II-containing protein
MHITSCRVTSAVSKKTTYLLIGRDAGQSKQNKAKEVGTKIMDEDQFYAFLENASSVAEASYGANETGGKGKAGAAVKVHTQGLGGVYILWVEGGEADYYHSVLSMGE